MENESACKDKEDKEPSQSQHLIQDGCKNVDETQSDFQNTQEDTLTPGSMVYSQDKVLGGHIATMFALLLTNRALLHMEIPDDIIEEEQRSLASTSTSVGLLRKEMHAVRVQEAREKESMKKTKIVADEDSDDALEEAEEEPIENEVSEQESTQINKVLAYVENCTGSDNNKAFRTKSINPKVPSSSSSQDAHSQRKIKDQEFKRTNQDCTGDTGIESAFEIISRHEQVEKNAGEETKRTGLTDCNSSSIDGDESAIPKKKRKVTSIDPDMAARTVLKRKSHAANDISQGSFNKQLRLEREDQPENYEYSGVINFKVKASGSSIAFLSDQQLINRFKDSSCADKTLCVLQPEMRFIRNRYHNSQKKFPGQEAQSEVKTMHVSRTALMFHRSEIAEKDPQDGRLFLSPESVALKPMKVYCHLNSLQHLYQMPTHDKSCNMDANVPIGNSLSDSPIDRFLRKDLQTFSGRELDRGLHLLSFEDFQSITRENFTWGKEELDFTGEVCTKAQEGREHGVTERDIAAIYIHYKGVQDMEEMLNMLLNFRLLLKVGIGVTRYVTPFFGSLWSMKSPQIDEESEACEVLQDGRGAEKGETANENGGKIRNGEGTIEAAAKCEENCMISDEKRGSACSPLFEKSEEANLDLVFGNQESLSSKYDKSNKKETVSPEETALEPRPKQMEEVSVKKLGCVEELCTTSHETIARNEPAQKEDRGYINTSKITGEKEEANEKHATVKYNVPCGVKEKDFNIPRDKITVSHTFVQRNETKDGKEETERCLVSHPAKTETYYRQAVCRPWLKLNCDLCPRMLRKFQRAMLSLIMMCPGIKESALQGHFRTLLSPIALREILHSLELNGCISKHVHIKIKKPSLFGSVDSFLLSDGECDNGESDDPYYLPKMECTLNITED